MAIQREDYCNTCLKPDWQLSSKVSELISFAELEPENAPRLDKEAEFLFPVLKSVK